MGFSRSVGGGFRNYATFSGRASRSQFWWWLLFVWLGGIGASIIDSLMGRQFWQITQTASGTWQVSASTVGFVAGVFSLVILLPTLAVSVRRLHDTDHSGWWWWLGLIPCVGWLIMIFAFYIQPGTPGENRFGPPPA
jgi:uncharacterized membrane protein YhaH (DUF805 family)